MSTIVFIPTNAQRAHQLVAAPRERVTAFTVTEELQSILDVTAELPAVSTDPDGFRGLE